MKCNELLQANHILCMRRNNPTPLKGGLLPSFSLLAFLSIPLCSSIFPSIISRLICALQLRYFLQISFLANDLDKHIITLFMSFSVDKLPELQAHLANNPNISEGGVPGPLDASIYFALGKLPDHATHPNLHYWYLFIKTFSDQKLKAWAEKYTNSQPAPTTEPKKETKNQDDIDLFGDDEPAAPTEKPKPKKQGKPAKQKPIAKSIVVFDVKVYEAGFDLDSLAKKILALEIDGLVWNQEPKILDVAYGVQMLQVGCVIEDDKVLTDDIFDKILDWTDDVQSVDMVSMQKL